MHKPILPKMFDCLVSIIYIAGLIGTGHTGAQEKELVAHTGGVLAISASADGKLLATGGEDGVVKVWEVLTGKEVCVFATEQKEKIYTVAFLNSEQVLSGSQDGTLRLWSNTKSTNSRILLKDVGYVSKVQRKTNNHWLVSTLDDVYEWDGDRFAVFQSWSATSMASSPDRKMIALGHQDGQINIYNSLSMIKLKSFVVPDSDDESRFSTRVDGLHFSPDNTSLAVLCSGRGGSTIHLIKVPNGDVQTLENTTKGWRRHVLFSPDGQYVIGAGFDLMIWNAHQKRLEKRIGGSQTDISPAPSYFTAMSFTNEMVPQFAVGCADGKVKLWDFRSMLKDER